MHFLAQSVKHYLVRFAFDYLVNLVGVLLGNIIDLLLAFFEVIFGDEFVFLLFFELLVGLSSNVANTDLCLLAGLFGLLDKLLSSFLTK